MSAPVSSSQQQQQQHPPQVPPIPPAKPILSSPGAYMANFTSSQTTPTAGIHSVNKSHEKPAIAARPIPPPTLPKYSASFGKVDRERNEFGKIDRAEREKEPCVETRIPRRGSSVATKIAALKLEQEGIGGSYRLASLDRLATRQRLLEANGGAGITSAGGVAGGGVGVGGGIVKSTEKNGTIDSNGGVLPSSLQSKREMFFKSEPHSPSGPPPNPPQSSSVNNNNNHVNSTNSTAQINTSSTTSTTNDNKQQHILTNNHTSTNNNHTTSATITPTTTNNVANNLNNLSLKEKLAQNHRGGSALQSVDHHNGNHNNHEMLNNNHTANNHHTTTTQIIMDSNKILTERHEREKIQQQQQLQQQAMMVRSKPKELDGYVGFANLPNQVYRKAVKKGFEFTLMVVGESGLGKSTLINSMFLSDIYNQDQHPGPSHRIKKTVAVETTKVLLKENGVNFTLTVVDTPGFGDAVDNSNCWVPVIDFVENKYEEYLTAESRVQRKAIPDTRVHCCLYFIAPSGHGLKPLDIEFMQRLCDKVNIIPVIAKADTMTPEEIQLFKKQVLNEIAQHKIKIYDFPEPLEEEEEAKVLKQLRSRVPFAVVGANTVIEIEGGKKIRGRKYPWGVAEVENLEHCDFIALRNMVIRTHLQDLKEVTNNVHYENYRCRKLAGLGVDGKTGGKLSNNMYGPGIINSFNAWNPLAQMEEEKRDHEAKMKKMEAEMEQVFEMKVKEKRQKLKDSEIELTRRHEERKKALEIQVRDLEEQRRAFEQERKDWEDSNGVTLEELRRRSLEANSKETVSLASRSSDESKSRRVFGSLLRRHTSFGAPDSTSRGGSNIASPQDNQYS